ncbi:translocation/assembly module TamB domain-containing protein, partial [Agarivorans sp.]|uniref:translocation/assembly module TamB domain-containing protein n=1 Tax=Agarivorans sp. TaxID=1872412 RepID=UPI003D08D93F
GEQAFKQNFASDLSGHWQMPLLEQSLSTQFSLNGDGKALALWLQSQGAVAAEVDGQLAWLKPNLPFDLRAELSQPLSLVAEQLSLERLSILAAGDLSAYQAQLNSELAGTQALRLSGDVQGDLSRLSAFALSGELLDGQATPVNDIDSAVPEQSVGQFSLKGAVAWQPLLQAQLDASFNQLQLSHWLDLGEQITLPDIDGQLSASLNDQQWQLSQALIQGRWLGLPLSAKASGHGNLAEQHNQATLDIQLAQQSLLATLEQQQQQIRIDGQLNAEQLADLPWFDKGRADAQVEVRGTLSQPLINWQLLAEQLGTADFSLAQVNSSGSLELDSTLSGQLQLGLTQLQVAGELIEQADVAYKSAQGKQSLNLSAEQAERSLHLSAQGQGDMQSWNGVLDNADISAELGRWDLSQDIELSYQQGVVSVGEHCWSRDVSQICLLQPFTSSGDSAVVLSMQQFNFAVLNSLMPEGTRLEGSASMDLDAQLAQWTPQAATLKLRLSPGSLVQQDEIETRELHYQSLALDAQLAANSLNWNAAFISKELGKLESSGTTSIDKNGEMDGTLNIDKVQLSPLLPFLPILDNIEGEINGQVLLSGAVTEPSLNGEIKLSETYLSGPQLPLSIEQLQTQLRFDNQQAELEGQFTSGGKLAQWQGQFAWPNNQLSGELDFNASLLPLVIDPYATFAVSPTVKIKIQPELIDISGDINVEEGSIKVKKLPDSAISESSDAIVIEEQTETVGSQRTQIDIRVSLADKITLEALGLNTRLKGLLSLKQPANEPLLADGRIELVDGNFRAYGQNLLIEKGWIMFNGPIEQPYLDFEAIRNPATISDDVTVGVKVIGLADAPQVTLFSEPSMSQNEMLSYLLRGRGLSDTEQDNNALSSMLLSAGIGRTEGFVGKVGSTLGLNDLSLSTAGSGSSTQVEVSAYVLPGVQVRYGMGVFDPVNELTVKYEILPKLFIEAFSGLNNALDVYYEFYLD